MRCYNHNIIRELQLKDDFVFNIVLEENVPAIIDYTHLKKGLSISKDKTLDFHLDKSQVAITSINELREIFDELVSDVAEFMCDNSLYLWDKAPPFSDESLRNRVIKFFSINAEDKKLLVNQLIIDILYDKYLDETEMTLNKFCSEYYYAYYNGQWKKIGELAESEGYGTPITKESAYSEMRRQLKLYAKRMKKPARSKDLEERGLNLDEHIKFIAYERGKKPRWIWDLIYYDKALPALKQFRIDSWDNNEGAYRKYADDLIGYDKFVEKAFAPIGDDDMDYYHKSMSRFYLESISRLEYMYKLANRLERDGITDISKAKYLTSQFSTEVSCPVMTKDGDLLFCTEHRYYSSRPFIESAWLDRRGFKLDSMENNPFFDSPINIIRAQTYGLFNYHYKLSIESTQSGYKEISDFIKAEFDILGEYHDRTKIWHTLEKGKPLSKELKSHLSCMRLVSDAVFSKVNKKNTASLLTSSLENEQGAYLGLYGFDKRAHDMMLDTITQAHLELHDKGGRPSKLSLEDKLAIYLVYNRYSRTYEDLASDYGVSKSRISDTIKWISETLTNEFLEPSD